MNFVFFSPHFPTSGSDFCDRLKKAGATVLGIGDAPLRQSRPPIAAGSLGILPGCRHGEL